MILCHLVTEPLFDDMCRFTQEATHLIIINALIVCTNYTSQCITELNIIRSISIVVELAVHYVKNNKSIDCYRTHLTITTPFTLRPNIRKLVQLFDREITGHTYSLTLDSRHLTNDLPYLLDNYTLSPFQEHLPSDRVNQSLPTNITNTDCIFSKQLFKISYAIFVYD